jgi:hypothetical protein
MNPKLLIAFAAVGGLTACWEGFLRETSSPAYAAGYQDGCRNGSSTASNATGEFIRNEARYRVEPDYAAGWRNGNRNCNGQNFSVNPTNPMEQIDIDGPMQD